jgi:cytochrome P450
MAVDPSLRPPNGFHPFRWEDAEDPFDALKELRAKCPISQVDFPPLPPAKLVTRYDHMATIFRDWKTFNNIGIAIDVERHKKVPGEQQPIISSNPPFHGPKRRVMLNAVAPAPVDRAKPALREFSQQVVDRFASRGLAELVAEWAKPIPSAGIAMALGLPVEDCLRHGEWEEQIVGGAARMSPSHPEFGQMPPGAYAPADDASRFAYVQEQIEKRRRGDVAEDDGLTAMLQARHPQTQEPYTDDEIIEAVSIMLAAGNGTTTSLMGNLVWRLAQLPDIYAALRADRSLIPGAIEESLRIDPPQQIFERVCMHDTEVGGVAIAEDEAIILSLASGNRDEAVYGEEADEFRLGRELPNPPNWSMGGGIHVCVGAYLARTSTEVGLNALLDRVETIALAPGFEYRKIEFHHFRAPRRLDVVFTTA